MKNFFSKNNKRHIINKGLFTCHNLLIMQQKGMRKFIITLFFLLFSFRVYASSYDAFILNFLRVNPSDNMIQIEMALDVPAENNIENNLKSGQVLKFVIAVNVSKERNLLPSKTISEHIIEYYLRYDPLTRQFMVINDEKPSIQNTDAHYLLETFIKNFKFQITTQLKKNERYNIDIDVNLSQSANQPWVQKNVFFLADDIIQPATFEYDFDY